MASLTIDIGAVRENIRKLDALLRPHGIEWTLVTKLLGGEERVLRSIIESEEMRLVRSIGDSRIQNLRKIREIDPSIRTMYLKPAPVARAQSIVECADISLNSSHATIAALDREAEKLGKKHEVVVMIEMGELREGVVRGGVLDFYESIFGMENIDVIGIGTNLGCMYGVEPTFDKLIQLSLYKELIEAKFDHHLDIVSGGSSITLPLLEMGRVPAGVNHFRIGESVFFGNSLKDGSQLADLSMTAFDFSAEIVEIESKEVIPDGAIGDAAIGITPALVVDPGPERRQRAIVDFGQIDVNPDRLRPKDQSVVFAGSTSDMTVYDLGEETTGLGVGDQLHFLPDYSAVARLMHSPYIDKKILN